MKLLDLKDHLKNKGITSIPNFKVDFLSAYYLKINDRMIAYFYF